MELSEGGAVKRSPHRQNRKTFFKKTIDKCNKLCYN